MVRDSRCLTASRFQPTRLHWLEILNGTKFRLGRTSICQRKQLIQSEEESKAAIEAVLRQYFNQSLQESISKLL